MKFLLILFAIIFPIIIAGSRSSDDYLDYTEDQQVDIRVLNAVKRELGNPLKLFGKCLTDSECKNFEYCDHHRMGFGECKAG